MLLDLHVHQLTKGMFNLDDHWGPFWENGTMRIGKWVLGSKRQGAALDELLATRWAPEPRIDAMNKAGHDKWVVSMPLHMVMYHTDPAFGIRHANVVNDSLAEFCATNPDRLFFWAQAPLQDPPAAAKEIDRAVNELGAKGLSMGGANFGGREADDPALFPVWEKLCELDLPVFCHGYNQSVTWGDKADTDRYDTTSIIGMNSDEALFYWYLTNGGVLDQFPDLRVIITHGGGFVPFQLGRFDATNQTMAPDSKNKKPLHEYHKNFFYDLDVQSPIMRRAIIDEVGIDQVVYGDNFGGADLHDYDLTDGMGLDQAQREQIRSTNPSRLVRL
jgi:aminocarboxymuconate-semialdehyde decarboxylase